MSLTIHQTDFYHPHSDPDDHWDVACEYILGAQKKHRLAGLLIDHPLEGGGAPAEQAIRQLNYITGQSVPYSVGSSRPYSDHPDREAAQWLLDCLDKASEPVSIIIAGSARDVAIAWRLRPDLFEEKCRGIYLNAGACMDNEQLEYNVELDADAYMAIFDIPCTIYWLPCFEKVSDFCRRYEQPCSTYFCFQQKEILPFLSPALQQYLLYMYGNEESDGLAYLHRPVDAAMLERMGEEYRNIWTLPSILHASGLFADKEGGLVSRPQESIYSFESIRIESIRDGFVAWKPSSQPTNIRLFRRRDPAGYGRAMTAALRNLLCSLG